MIKRALRAFRSEDISSEEQLRSLWLACRHAGVMWDDESWDVLTERHLKLAREAGALTVLPLGLNIRTAVDTFRRRAGQGRVADRGAASGHRGDRRPVPALRSPY